MIYQHLAGLYGAHSKTRTGPFFQAAQLGYPEFTLAKCAPDIIPFARAIEY